MFSRLLFVTVGWLSITPCVNAQLFSTRVASGFSSPDFGTPAPGEPNTLYIVQQGGLIRPLNLTNGTIGTTFLNLPGVSGVTFTTGGERGLLGLAFDPNYVNNGRLYVDYTDGNGNLTVDRFTASGGVVNTASRQNIISIAHPSFANHNAGWIAFGPNDGYLYVATGDGGSANDPNNNSQNLNALLGKMLRLDVSGVGAGYAIPPTNPFVGNPNARGEIWAYGLRNPWRNSFDRSGNLYIADVGQDTREEINFQASAAGGGQNYGWRIREGKIQNPAYPSDPPPVPRVDPFYDYTHNTTTDPFAGHAIIGGYVYRGGNILDHGQSLDGTYFFADEVDDRIWSLRYTGSDLTSADVTIRTGELLNAVNGGTINAPSSFAEDAQGRLYILDLADGEIFRIDGAAIPEPQVWLAAGAGIAVLGWFFYRWQRRRCSMTLDTLLEEDG
jgi:glucose/arabinose dehydrogenase